MKKIKLTSISVAILIFALLFSCDCKKINQHTVKPKSVPYIFSNAYEYDQVRHVYQAGMHYVVIYYNGTSVVNITKDSLEVALLKKQSRKDSLQIEVFNKYLKIK